MVRAYPVVAVGLVVALSTEPVLAQTKPHPAVVAHAKAAADKTMDCYGKGIDSACETMIAEIRSAMAAPQATASDRHDLLKKELEATSAYGFHLIEKGQIAKALDLLRAGEAKMLEHNAKGGHFHTYIENIPLQKNLVKAYYAAGRTGEADVVIERVRDAISVTGKAMLENAQTTDPARKRYFTQMDLKAVAFGEQFESDLTEYLQDRISKRQENTELQRRALDHATNAVAMTEAAARKGIQLFADDRPEMRLAEALDRRGRLQFGLDMKQQAAASFIEGAAWACTLEARYKREARMTDAQRRAAGLSVESKGADPIFRNMASEKCQRMAVKWLALAPRDLSEREAAFKRWADAHHGTFGQDVLILLGVFVL